MSHKSKKEYLEEIRKRYHKSNKKEKTAILDEFCKVCGYNRNYAIRLLNKPCSTKSNGRQGRPKLYDDPRLFEVIKTIWRESNLPCSKRLKEILMEWIEYYSDYYGIELEDGIIKLAKNISASVIDTLLSPFRKRYNKIGLCTTKPGSIIRKHIPIKTEQWNEKEPGNLEADTVAHCGSKMSGDFAYTLDTEDILTGWIEPRAILGKGEKGVLKAVKDIENALPFKLLGFDSDNGSEFMNWHLIRYFQDRKNPVNVTRSREYKKNDNAHIEEKNWSKIRQWIGYMRIDNPEAVELLNDLYKNEFSQLHNYFIPSFKLIKKERIGSKIIKRYQKPKTAYQNVLECKNIPKEKKSKLIEKKKNLNPFILKKIIKEKILYILNHANKSI